MTSLEKAINLGYLFLTYKLKKKKNNPSIHAPIYSACFVMFQFIQKSVFDPNTCNLILAPILGTVWCPLVKLSNLGLEHLSNLPTLTTILYSNHPLPVVPEPDTTTTTCVYSNPCTQNSPVPDLTPPPQNAPVPDMTPPPQNSHVLDLTPPPQNLPIPDPTPPPTTVACVPDTTSPTTITPTVVADCNGLKWYNS